jgi:hypothetical protein
MDASISICGKPRTILAGATHDVDLALLEQTIESQDIVARDSKAIVNSVIPQPIDQILTDRLVGMPSFDGLRR